MNKSLDKTLKQYSSNHFGSFFYGGNKEKCDVFKSIGKYNKNKCDWNNDKIVWWASGGKIMTGLVVAKMIEEEIITPYTTLFSLNNIFTGKGTYFKSISILNPLKFPFDPSSYSVTLDTFDWETITIGDLLQFNIGLIGDYFAVPSAILSWLNPDNIKKALENNTVFSLGSYIQFVTFFKNMANKTPIGIGTQAYNGEPILKILTTFLPNIIDSNVSGTLPLLFKPKTIYTNLLPYGTDGFPAIYDTSMVLLVTVLDHPLQLNGYKNFADYSHKKILCPLGCKDSYIVGQEIIPNKKRKNIVGTSWRRAPIYNLTKTFDINDVSSWAGYGVSPEYADLPIGEKGLGQLVWSQDYPNDGISKLMNALLYNDTPYPDKYTVGNAPLISSIKDFSKILKMILNKGISSENKQILNPDTFEYLISPKIPTTSGIVTSSIYSIFDFTEEYTNTGFAMGFGRINRDLTSSTLYGFDPHTCYWYGFSGIGWYLNIKTKNWFIYGIPESRLSSGTFPKILGGNPSHNAIITSSFLLSLNKQPERLHKKPHNLNIMTVLGNIQNLFIQILKNV
jgi:hypothetical protein